MFSQPTIIRGEPAPATNNGIAPDPTSQAGPAENAEADLPPAVNEMHPSEAASGGFLNSFRKRMRSVAGVDSHFVNPYLGNGHSSTKLPPYGPTSPSPAGLPTSSVLPPPHPFQWGNDFYQQQAMMYGGLPYRMPMMNYPMGGSYYGPPHHYYGQSPYLYPSTSLMDYAHGMHDPYYGGGGYPYAYGGHPYSASALPVQDKRLLPERNYFSAVKDIWHTNLQ
ncbi:hypothetical protein [Absidia glauca]|uniref:Uncharacterized protein n=1 Tax=Absidia glauca TaxID=4829 RepID=A0A163MJ76_ABSGL|nr:hypothetical protein [Absidia glauca]